MTTIHDRIDTALLRARYRHPYFGRLLGALTFHPTPSMPHVMGVSATGVVYYNPEMCADLDDENLCHTILHELEHVRREHHRRAEAKGIGPQDRGLAMVWNLATDAEINDDFEQRFPGWIYPALFEAEEGDLAEAYYDILLDQMESLPQSPCGGGSGVSGQEEEWEEGGPKGMNPIQMDAALDATAADVKAHVAKNPGTLSAELEMWADNRVGERKVDWRQVLAGLVGQVTQGGRKRSDYAWQRMSRRQGLRGGVRVPGVVSYDPEVAMVVDTSGSMWGLGPEVQRVVDDIRDITRPRLVCVDTEVHSSRKLSRGHKVRYEGGGGTDLRTALQREAMGGKWPDAVVVVTDGYTPWPEVKPNPDTVFIVCLAGTKEELRHVEAPDWARTVRVEVDA